MSHGNGLLPSNENLYPAPMVVVRQALNAFAVHALRYLPVNTRVKEWLIWLGSPRVLAVAVALIPDVDGRLLLLRARYSGDWILPGGAMHNGEQPAEGIRRECEEELGQAVDVQRFNGMLAI